MNARGGSTLAILAVAAALAVGCGGAHVQTGGSGCEVEQTGVTIVLGNSSLSCADAQSIVFLMSGGESKGVEVIRGPGGTWRCTGFSEGEGGRIRRTCRNGQRSFDVRR
jgi:hypothetical protein